MNRVAEFEKKYGSKKAIEAIEAKFMTFAKNCGWADKVENLKITFHAWYNKELDKTFKYYKIEWWEGCHFEHGTYDKGWFRWETNGINCRLN